MSITTLAGFTLASWVAPDYNLGWFCWCLMIGAVGSIWVEMALALWKDVRP